MRIPSSLRPILAGLLFLLSGCGLESAGATGVARVLARPGSDADRIARVVVTVSPGDGPAFPPLRADLARDGDGWRARIARIPVGPSRRFDAVAYDAAGLAILAGTARSDVVAQGAAVVVLALDAGGAPSFDLGAIAYAPSWVPRRGVVTLTAAPAHDPDPGDVVSYRWTSSCAPAGPGAFDDPTAPSTRWTAPDAPATCHLTLTATDGRGLSAQTAITVPVFDTADPTVIATDDAYPIILALRATIVLGDPMQADLSVEALDPEGAPLSFAWSSEGPDGCPGISFDTGAPHAPSAPHVTLPPPAASCRLEVVVRDGHEEGTRAALWLPPGIVPLP